MYNCLINKKDGIGKLLWNKRNQTLQSMLLLTNKLDIIIKCFFMHFVLSFFKCRPIFMSALLIGYFLIKGILSPSNSVTKLL